MNPTDKQDTAPGEKSSTAADTGRSKTAFSLSELEWRALIIASTAVVLLFSVYCLSNGITTIFMHLYYFPIVLLAYRYRMKGAVLASLPAVAYVALVIIYDYGQAEVIAGAFYRFIVFIAIAAVVGFLSEQLFRVQRSLKESADIRERYISLAPAIILVLDAKGKITHLNNFGCSILGCSVMQVQGKPWVDTFIPEEQRDTVHQIFESVLRGDIETYREVEHDVITMEGAARTIRWHNTTLTDESGKITGTLSYGEDVTEKKHDEEIIHSLQQFQEGIITNANVWITVLSPKGKILVWNNAAEAISGYPKWETLGTTTIWKKLYPDPFYRKWVTGEIARVITRDTYLEDFETEIQCRDGSKKTIAWNTKGLRDAKGDIESFIAVGRDVTGRRKAQDAIAASEEKYRTLVEQISDVIYSLDGHGVITYISPAIEKISGYPSSEIIGIEYKQFIFSDDLPQVREIFEDGKNGNVKSFQFRIVDRDGELRWLRVSSEPFKENGELKGINGVMLDITEQKRAEDALKKSQSLLSNAMDLAHMASWEYDVDTGLFTFDDRFYALYGTTAEREGGYRMPAEVYAREFVHPDDMAVVAEEIRKAVETPESGYTCQMEHRIIRRDGAVRYIIVHISITKDSAGRTIRTHGANQDITERKRAEEALQESEQKFRDLFENSQDGIAITETSSRKIVDSNIKFSRMLGYNQEEIKNLGVPDIHPEDSLPRVFEVFGKMVRHETNLAENIPVKRKDGTIFYADISVYTISISGKDCIVGVFRDITERKKAELELRKLASIVEHSDQFIGLSNPDGTILFLNNAGARMIGVDPEEVISHKFMKFIPEHIVDIFQNEILPGLHQKGSWEGDMQLFNQLTGRLVDVHSMIFTISDPSTGDPLYLANISLDITERKKMELALQESEEKYRTYIENALEGIFIADKTGRYIDVNPSACRLVGYSRDEMLNLTIADLAGRKADMDGFKALLSTGRDIREILLKRKDGSLVPVILNAVMLPDGNLIGFCTDITSRKQMEEALQKSEEKYRAYIENALESIFITDKTGRYLDVNPSACQMLGYTREELLIHSIQDLAGDEADLAGFETLMREGRVIQEISLKRKDGTLVPVILNAVMLPDGNLMGFCTDITGRKRTEDALALASRKLNLLSSITRHDILNQLMVLIGYLDMALEDVTDPEQRRFIEVEMLAAKTIQRQIEFTREYQNLGMQAPVWLNINKSLTQATFSLQMRDVTISIDRTDLEIYADRLFDKVFYNLIDNALRYGGDRMTSISVSSREEEAGLVITFEDNGAGIRAEDKSKLFTRGFGQNTGLGLFLSREILSITGITIEETSETGNGARFEIIVPKGMYRYIETNSTGNGS